MADELARTCPECQGAMSEIIIMDQGVRPATYVGASGVLSYRQPDDKQSFWTGKYPTAGRVLAFLCGDCGRIALYGGVPNA
jgi:hypothetical protein